MKEVLILLLGAININYLAAKITCNIKEVHSEIAISGSEEYFDEYGNEDCCKPIYPLLYSYAICTTTTIDNNSAVLHFSSSAKYATFVNSVIPTLPVGIFSKTSSLIDIYLNGSGINFIQPGAFNGLNKLKSLHLENNELTEVARGTFHSLMTLEILDLSKNQIEVIEDNAFLGLSNLNSLSLNQNNIKIISDDAFKGLHNMRFLNISQNRLTALNPSVVLKIFAIFENDSQVFDKTIKTILDLSHNVLSNISYMDSLEKNIQYIYLSHNNFSNVVNVPKASRALDISHNYITNIAKLTENFNNTDFLDLSHNMVTNLTYNVFENACNLQHLCLDNNLLQDIPFGCFQNLDKLLSLNLSSNLLKEFDYGTFAGLVNLEILDISNNSLNNLFASSFHMLRSLKSVNIARNKLVVLDPYDILSYSKNLKTIGLNDNPWNCDVLLKITDAFHKGNVIIYDSVKPKKSVRFIFGITCFNEPTTSTVKPHTEMSDFEKFFKLGFRNTSFYNFFQNYKNPIVNETQFLESFQKNILNITNEIELSETKMLNASLTNLQNFYKITHNVSDYFDKDFKTSSFYKFFNKDFSNANFFKFFNRTNRKTDYEIF